MDRKVLEKRALNKFEQHLWDQPAGRKFDDVRVQRAYGNLQESKDLRVEAEIINTWGDGSNAAKKKIELNKAHSDLNIQKNRNNIAPSIKSPFSTRKSRKGNGVLTNDTLASTGKYTKLQNQIDAKKTAVNIANRPENKFLNKAKNYIVKHPGKSALMGLAGAGVLGAIGYGWKKEIKD
jgi:hypothetical protein